MAQFGAQFKLFGQGITNALAQAQDPERCDEQLSRLLVQLEELESQFGDHEQFLGDILAKREELLETFEAHKQTLLDERQRKAQGLLDAARRILDSLQRRTARFTQAEELNAFFAADPLILKLRELAERLRELKDSVKADDVEARLKAARDQAVRALRDKSELFEEGGDVIRLGPRHRFSVNTQELDLTLMPRGDALYLHLTGTDFLEPLQDPRLDELRGFWQVNLESESETLYRAEYLAGEVLAAADAGRDGFSLERLQALLAQPDELARAIRDFAAPRQGGYEKGIHDHDAAAILVRLLPLRESAGLLRYAPSARAFASLFWSRRREEREVAGWPERARSSRSIQQMFGRDDGLLALRGEVASAMRALLAEQPIALDPQHIDEAAEYLVWELSAERPNSPSANMPGNCRKDSLRLQGARLWDDYRQTLERLGERPAAQWELAGNWLRGLCGDAEFQPLAAYLDEAVALSLLDEEMPRRITEVDLRFQVDGLMGEHPRIVERGLALAVDDFFGRLRRHRQQFLPGLRRYQALRQEIVEHEREALRLAEFKPRPLSSFVRNKLINDVYLGVIGDNLAKQMGTVGENKRTDLMGLLMLISPPGYGKTTLMEYVAHRLGLIFEDQRSCPRPRGALARPGQAPDATSRQELEKLNLALEMGNNVMLYVDDIQHTHPEFLQKFISSATARAGWKGCGRAGPRPTTCGAEVLRGDGGQPLHRVRRGLPHSRHARQPRRHLQPRRHPQRHAGGVLLSYIENALTSNRFSRRWPPATWPTSIASSPGRGQAVLQQRAGPRLQRCRDQRDQQHPATPMQVRDVVLKVNQQYIASAAQADQYRSEPPFAAGQLPQHEQDGGEDLRGDERCRAAATDRRPLPGRVATADHRSRGEPAEARRTARQPEPRAGRALGADQA